MLEWLNTIIDYYARTRRFVWLGFNWSDDEEEDTHMIEGDDEFEEEK